MIKNWLIFILLFSFLPSTLTLGKGTFDEDYFYNFDDGYDDQDNDFFDDRFDELEDFDELNEEEKKDTVFYKRKTIGVDEIAVVQSVSSSKKTIVLRRGNKQGITVGHQALLSTDKISVLCKATQVSRRHSLWEVVDPGANLPFEKGEFIVFNQSTESLFDQIPALQERLQAEIKRRTKVFPPVWILRGGGSYGVYESVSDTTTSLVENRLGSQFEVTRYKRLMKRIEWGLGIRADVEVAILKSSPKLEIPTNRYFLMGEFLYHFPFLSTEKTHFYGGLGIGVGPSYTVVSSSVSTGYALALPVMRLGLQTDVTEEDSLIIEGVAEGVSMVETFDDGTKQNTNIANLKIIVGWRF